MPTTTGRTVWLTGLPSAGKTTLAHALVERCRETDRAVELLDGDEVRRTLCADLGFSRADRSANVARLSWVAQRLTTHGVVTVVSAISPYAADRDAVRRAHEEAGLRFVEVFVATPLQVCVERDVKGLYARRAAGEIAGLTGVDDPYEPPARPEVCVDTTVVDVERAVGLMMSYVR